MTSPRNRQLLRHLAGELPAEELRELERAAQEDPDLAGRLARWRQTWDDLALPDPRPAPPGFAARVSARRPAGGIGWSAAPGWVRSIAVGASILGLAVGVLLGRSFTAPPDPTVSWVWEAPDPGLAEAYWRTLEAESPGDALEGTEVRR
jgi:anti-sigma factor RsiW